MTVGVKIGKGNGYKAAARKRRAIRVRKRVSGTPVRPRLVVSRSNRHLHAGTAPRQRYQGLIRRSMPHVRPVGQNPYPQVRMRGMSRLSA